MTPIQAIELLDNVTSQVALNRADHEKVQQAVAILKALIVDSKGDN